MSYAICVSYAMLGWQPNAPLGASICNMHLADARCRVSVPAGPDPYNDAIASSAGCVPGSPFLDEAAVQMAALPAVALTVAILPPPGNLVTLTFTRVLAAFEHTEGEVAGVMDTTPQSVGMRSGTAHGRR